MATNSLQSLNYHHPTQPLGPRHSTTTSTKTLALTSPISNNNYNKKNNNKNNTNISISSTSSYYTTNVKKRTKALLSNTTTSSAITTNQTQQFDLLTRLLSDKDFREADNETRRLLIALAGEAAQKRGYVFFSEVQFIAESDLKTIDQLWRDHSNNKFGYSVQKRLWEKSDRDFTKFFIKLGWMKKLDTEVLQYNYRAFPDEFIWELSDDTPEGHLPLTNALRGTQLFTCILTHPAFEEDEAAVEEERESSKAPVGGKGLGGLFKTNYSF